jgi:hypothetical protein
MVVTTSEGACPLSGSDATTASLDGGIKAQDPELPRAVGYLRKHLLMTETDVRYAKERLAYFAPIAGLHLERVYVEELETWPTAFEALVEAAVSDELTAVLLPSMLHFAVLGPPASIKQYFEHLTHTRVLAVQELVSYRPGEAAS